MGKQNAAIVYLTKNDVVTKTHLKYSLYFLFKHFNAKYRYPVILFHEGDFDARAQEEILLGVRSSCRSLVSFYALDPEEFQVPDHIDKEKMQRCIETVPVPYWRNVGYRNMCRFWVRNLWKYVDTFDYVMRLDSDSIIECPLNYDLFEWAANKDLIYSSVMLHIDCSICCYGMKEFFDKLEPERKDQIRQLFVPQKIPMRDYQFVKFRQLLSIIPDGPQEIPEHLEVWAPINYFNNLFISRPSFWKQENVQRAVQAIDETGGYYYLRWGDAPLHTILVSLYAKPEQIERCVFPYSKRLQRDSFPGDDGKFHSYMPSTYDKSSCITETEGFAKSFLG